MCLDRQGRSLTSSDRESSKHWLGGLRRPQVRRNQQGWVLWNHRGGFGIKSSHGSWQKVSVASQSQGSLHFQPGLSLYLLVNSEPGRGATNLGDLARSQQSVFSSCFWCRHQSQAQAEALLLGHRELDMRQPLQFPWETENIFPTLWMRKLKQREKRPRLFKEVKSQELWG